MRKGFIGGVTLAIVLVVGLICTLVCVEKIPVGYEGVVYSMNGGVQKETLTQGWHLVSPTKKVKEFAISEPLANDTSRSILRPPAKTTIFIKTPLFK